VANRIIRREIIARRLENCILTNGRDSRAKFDRPSIMYAEMIGAKKSHINEVRLLGFADENRAVGVCGFARGEIKFLKFIS
jgi:hypothetical protein